MNWKRWARSSVDHSWGDVAYRLALQFRETAKQHDKEATFPFDHFEALRKEGILSLTTSKRWGGAEADLYTFLLVQEILAYGDGATSLSLGWHNGTMLHLHERNHWPTATFERVSKEVVASGALINSAATEKATGSPTRGGKPETIAEETATGYLLSGHKTFTSLAPALTYAIVPATHKETGDVIELLVPMNADGVEIERTWETLGMRATRSDDLYLRNVRLPKEANVGIRGQDKSPQPWLLHIPACYLGIAVAARDEALEFAKSYAPNSLGHPIAQLAEIQRSFGEVETILLNAHQLLYGAASRCLSNEEIRVTMGQELMAVKTGVVNAAVDVIDRVMRIVGAHSMRKESSLERYYRDVRAGLHNPPSDDVVYRVLGATSVRE
ncbi:acyl-CoA dehydrogenase family protein [Bacillus fonticola]|uniref:acyl-CoA dehydrogenase family protein n=1 Tax=Bacillus fonticola TaxID=2728853 RepID=UPI001D156658|nr:acyl-CoA dehydrogenase family protein [Bacillus fonticola]